MTLLFKKCLFCCLTLLSLSVFGETSDKHTLNVSQGYIRETIPGTQISSAYLTIHNTGSKALNLISVTSKVSPRLELHEHSMADGMMKMRQVPYITIPANGEVTLKPSGLHIMIFDLTKGLVEGQQVSLNLLFSNQEVVTISLPVKSIKQHHH